MVFNCFGFHAIIAKIEHLGYKQLDRQREEFSKIRDFTMIQITQPGYFINSSCIANQAPPKIYCLYFNYELSCYTGIETQSL